VGPLLNIEEALLVRRAARGDLAAFERLYRTHIGRVYAICVRLVADPVRAEELAQDAFVRAWERLGTFQGHARFYSWLYRLTVNVVVESQRSQGRLRLHEVSAEGEDGSSDGVPDHMRGDSETHQHDPGTRLDLERAIASLPSGARAVFVLHDIEGYEHHEIAEMTGTTVGTSKGQLHRARRLLRGRLER
jgi:RNA polymerase sigma-70 factor (ECF subfamily)